MRGRRAPLLAIALVAALTPGCAASSPGADKAGGSSGGTIVLRLAFTPAFTPVGGGSDPLPAVADFIRRVTALSHGTIRIRRLGSWGSFEPDAEVQVVRAVASGAVDLGLTRSNVFDTLGVSSFEALSAPMLIDSYPLENAVIDSGIPVRMLSGLKRLGVTGLAVLAEDLRVPIGAHRPLLSPADWRRVSFGTYRSAVQEEVIRALGATPVVIFGPFRSQALTTGRIQAFEQGVVGTANNGLVRLAPWFTSNIALWPEIDVLLANPGRLGSLTDEQRAWLSEAAQAAARDSAALSADDGAYVRADCAAGARFINATSADLSAMRAALSPVYRQIESNPQARAFIEQIQALKRSTRSGPVIRVPPRCTRTR
jgi:TRAP-type C4-dicarboxylate transport system substrate-binding protein